MGAALRGDWLVAAAAAVAAPTLIAFNLPPSATFLNQAAAVVGWGAWALMLVTALPRGSAAAQADAGARALLAALLLMAASAFASPLWARLPWSLALPALGLIAAAILVASLSSALQRGGRGEEAFAAFCVGLLVAGLAGTLIGVVQVHLPSWADGTWIAASAQGDRAVGNLRQPNHLSSLLLWAMIATLWLGESGRLPRRIVPPLLFLLLAGVVLTASRTGMVGAGLLALWGLVDRRLSRAARVQLWLMPLAYWAFYELYAAIAHQQAAVFGGEVQLQKSDISSSRFAIWSNTLSLIAAHPWTGVGFGEFNFAWSLNVFPDRPVAFFDHTHNLPLHLAAELGLPLATLVTLLLLFALWRGWRMALEGAPGDMAMRRAALAMVVMIALHSLLEYPLWYSYFLLPAAFAFGLALGGPAAAPTPAASPGPGRGWPLAATLLLVGGVAALVDYQRVVVIFAPPAQASPLAQRIAEGRKSWFNGHHADYAAATSSPRPSQQMPSFARATHYLLDTRIMIAWAKALAESGEIDKARHLAARLREFRNPLSAEFFAECDKGVPEGEAKPFQCEPPQRRYDFTDFR